MMTTVHITPDMFEDRETGLLTKAAGLALMPYMNEEARAEESLHRYFINGEDAMVSRAVEESDSPIIGNEAATGRIYANALTWYKQLLGIKD